METPLGGVGPWLSCRWREGHAGWRARREWLAPFAVLLGVIVLTDLAGNPGRTLLPVYAEAALRRPPYFTSMLVSIRLLMGGAAAFAGGPLCDALGQKRVVLLGLTGVPLVGGLLLLRSPLALVLLSIYAGISAGAYYFGVDSYMMAVVPLSFLGTATALVNGFQTLGGALGSSLAGPVADRYGFAAVGLGTMALGALVFVGCGLLLPARGRASGAVVPARLSMGYGRVLRRPPVLLLALLRILPTAYYGTIVLLMPLLIYRVARVPSAAAYYATTAHLFSSGCQLVAGRICDRYGRNVIVVGSMALMVFTALATPFFTHSLIGLYVFGTLGAGMAWALTVAVPGLICDISPLDERPRTLGLIHVAWYAGMIGGTQAAGWLVQTSAALPFLVAGLLNVAGLAVAIRLVQRYTGPRAAGEG